MNTKKNLLILNGQIKTEKVESCINNQEKRKYEVKFYDNDIIYDYNYDNVVWINNPIKYNPNMFKISRNGIEFNGIKEIYVFKKSMHSYWHICFEKVERDYKEQDLTIVESCLNNDVANNVFEYLKEVSTLSNLKNEETGEKMLPKKYEEMAYVGTDVVLAHYLNPVDFRGTACNSNYAPIFPFGCNNSQYKAVKCAMENQISVIQGPPGTGKTQTILNIIANILLEGKTVQIVSNNNSATENVKNKLSDTKNDFGFILAMLGNSENKRAFIKDQNTKYPDFSTWILGKEKDEVYSDAKNKSLELRKMFDKKELLAQLKQEQSHLMIEYEHFKEYLDKSNIEIKKIDCRRKFTAKRWLEIWRDIEIEYEEKNKISFWLRLKGYIKYGIKNKDFFEQNIEEIISIFQTKYYETKQKELSNEIENIEKYLKAVGNDLLEEMCAKSMMVLKDCLARKYEGRANRPIFNTDDLWKNSYEFLKEYPVVLSTTFSSKDSLNTKVVYDYIIMDEASQIDVTTGALALSCAKNVVVVGDTKQLPNIVKEDDKKTAKEMFEKFNINEGYMFTKSFLQSIMEILPDVKQTLLREHYRCHPKIINFCNQKFYRNELIIMTEDNDEKDVLVAIKTVPGNHIRGHYSQREIDVIRQEVIPNYVENICDTGIISPYRDQVKALQSELPNMEVDTVHKFQGREKEMIIISTVEDKISDFVDDPYLINVAVSRAKKKLVLVTTGNEQTRERNITDLVEYIRYNNFEIINSKIYSVFDYLYKHYTEEREKYLQKYKRISRYDSENLMYVLLNEILTMDGYECLDVIWTLPMNKLIRDYSLLNEAERKYAKNIRTHIDFVIFNRISKKCVLAIEVDGYGHHKKGSVQSKRDDLKDHILELCEIPLLRFKTNGSGEKERIIEKLTEVMRG